MRSRTVPAVYAIHTDHRNDEGDPDSGDGHALRVHWRGRLTDDREDTHRSIQGDKEWDPERETP